MKHYLKIIFLLFYFISPLSSGATLNDISVEKKGARYILHIEAQVKANVNRVKQIITDYGNLTLINPYLKESNIISIAKDKRVTVSMLTHACVLFICYKIRHVQVYQRIDTDIIYGRIIPKMSDFKQGWTRWIVKQGGPKTETELTQLTLDTEMTPDFFILPIIGTHHLKKKILEIASATINNLEKEAQKNYR